MIFLYFLSIFLSNFIHSNYYEENDWVMSEDIDSENPLSDSNYRVIGKLFSREVILNWINNYHYN